MKWLPLERMLVCYVDDPALYHERVIVRCHGEDSILVAIPDREIFRTELVVGETYFEIKRISSTRLPGGLTENDAYMEKHSGEGTSVARSCWRWCGMPINKRPFGDT